MTYLLAVRGLLSRVPWQMWAILGLLAVWYIDRTRYGNERAYEARAEMQAKIDRADADRAKALASEEQALRNLAQRTDRNVTQARAENRDRVDDFIRRGGVRPCPGSGQAPRAGAGSGEGVHPEAQLAPAEPVQVVGVTASDVRICTDNTLLAEQFRAFILGLEKGQAGRP